MCQVVPCQLNLYGWQVTTHIVKYICPFVISVIILMIPQVLISVCWARAFRFDEIQYARPVTATTEYVANTVWKGKKYLFIDCEHQNQLT